MKCYINVFKYKDKYSFTNFSRVLSHQLQRIMALNDAMLEPNGAIPAVYSFVISFRIHLGLEASSAST
jgi:hypothetical protein